MDSLRYVCSSNVLVIYCDVSSQVKNWVNNCVWRLFSVPTLFHSGSLLHVAAFHVQFAHAKPRQAMSVYTPVKHRPEWYWKEIFERRGIEAPGSSGYEDGWGGLVYKLAAPAKRPKDTWKVVNLKLSSQNVFLFHFFTYIVWYCMYQVHLVLWWSMTRPAACLTSHFRVGLFLQPGHPAGCLAWHPLQPVTERGVGMSGSQWTLLGPLEETAAEMERRSGFHFCRFFWWKNSK